MQCTNYQSTKHNLPRPCGQCIHCRISYARSKAIRAVHELNYWDTASFLTLTYDENNLEYLTPTSLLPSVQKSTLQLFLKRLRKKIEPVKISYMASAEYGDQFERPHYHIILYGYDFSDDRLPVAKSGEHDLYRSPTLENLWKYGQSVVAGVSYDTMSYVAGYTVKKSTGVDGKTIYDNMGRLPPFGLMSRNPAIGKRWIEDHWQECVRHDSVRINGKNMSLPRYYNKYLEITHPQVYKNLTLSRLKKLKILTEKQRPKPISNALKKQKLKKFQK